MAAQIDKNIPLFAPLSLNPHVSSRPVLHQEFSALATDDWLWLDVSNLPNVDGVQSHIQNNILPNYEIVEANDGYLRLRPDGQTQSLSPEFYSFVQAQTKPQYETDITFNEHLKLVGYGFELKRAEEVQVTTYWQALAPLPNNVRPILYLLDEQGHPQGASNPLNPPATVLWYPPETWSMGQTIALKFNDTFALWDTRKQKQYRLAVGISSSTDAWDVGARWLPKIATETIKQAPYLATDSSLVELGRFERVWGMVEGGAAQRLWSAPAVDIPLNANFSNEISLYGATEPQIIIKQDGLEQVTVNLVWQAQQSQLMDYVRFVHVVGPTGLQGQLDARPVNNTYPTPGFKKLSKWLKNKAVMASGGEWSLW